MEATNYYSLLSTIYLTIMPTERYPSYSTANPISIALPSTESLLLRHNSQLLRTGATIATYIFNSFSLFGNIYVSDLFSDKSLYANLSNPRNHASGFCARDGTPLYQCYWWNRRSPPMQHRPH